MADPVTVVTTYSIPTTDRSIAGLITALNTFLVVGLPKTALISNLPESLFITVSDDVTAAEIIKALTPVPVDPGQPAQPIAADTNADSAPD